MLQGATSSASVQSVKESPEMLKRRNDALQNMAWSPIKQILMMSFMMYMAGTNLHFFSILTVINGMYSPVNAILRSKTSKLEFCIEHYPSIIAINYVPRLIR